MKRETLIALRKSVELKQEEFADILGISRGHYSNIETGIREPSFALARRISLFFNKSTDDIFFSNDASSGRKTAS